MTLGHESRGSIDVRRDSRASDPAAPARHDPAKATLSRRSGAIAVDSVLALHATAGNLAVRHLLHPETPDPALTTNRLAATIRPPTHAHSEPAQVQRQAPQTEELLADRQIRESELNRELVLDWIQTQDDLLVLNNEFLQPLRQIERQTAAARFAAMPTPVHVPGRTAVLILPADIPLLTRSAQARADELFLSQPPSGRDPVTAPIRRARRAAWDAAWAIASPLLRLQASTLDEHVRRFGYRVTHYAAGVGYAASVSFGPGAGAAYQPLVRMYDLESGEPTDFATWSDMGGVGTPGASITSGWLVAFRFDPSARSQGSTDNRLALQDWLGGSWFLQAGAGLIGGEVSIGVGLLRGDAFWVTSALDVGWTAGVMGGIQWAFPAARL